MPYVHIDFPGSQSKTYEVVCTTYYFLVISALVVCAIFG